LIREIDLVTGKWTWSPEVEIVIDTIVDDQRLRAE